jgi:hypothetical protein
VGGCFLGGDGWVDEVVGGGGAGAVIVWLVSSFLRWRWWVVCGLNRYSSHHPIESCVSSTTVFG